MKIELTKNETETLCTENNNKNEIESFDDILEIVGSDGPFQQRFNWIFNFTYAMILSMTFMNVIIALAIPEHWCYVPGRENTNYTVQEWREKTIPKYVLYSDKKKNCPKKLLRIRTKISKKNF